MREEINTAINKLQPQFKKMKADLNECNKKLILTYYSKRRTTQCQSGQDKENLDKETILKIAKKEGVMNFGRMTVGIFPDLTSEMARRRAQFKDVRAKLREAGIKHGIVHPATLIVTFNGDTKYVQYHKTAEIYFSKVIKIPLYQCDQVKN